MSGRRLSWSRRATKFGMLCAAFALVIGLKNSAAKAQADAGDKATAERGRKQFEQSCGFCHGADATGARGPDLVRSPLVAHDVKGDQIGQVIRQGRPDKGTAHARRGRATFGKRAQRISSREVTYRKRRGWKSIFQWRRRLQQMSFGQWRFGGHRGQTLSHRSRSAHALSRRETRDCRCDAALR